ncbi:MAG: lysophospholipid acyltransferase family protein [Candidatus Omnitrophica bacterium]|nr:lysophospholipid acyltransferase family protein [Candidatus Omnitrophota bacterium]
MILYILYRIGYFLVNLLPLKFSYRLACAAADICCLFCAKDRRNVIDNLKTISGPGTPPGDLRRMARELYRNFAKYLVDFFRSEKVDEEYVKRFVKVEGARHLDSVLAEGKGAILLSAHIGNWELGGSVVSLIGYPASAVVLSHKNKKIKEFFNKRRLTGKLMPIEMGTSLKACYKLLASNRVLALLGDRDFTKNGLRFDFFGRKTLFPKGPAVFSYRLGAPIIPTLIVRQPDDTFLMTFEEPIRADSAKKEDEAVPELGRKCASIIESYVKKYPTQWYVFKDMWSKDE